MTTAKNEGNQKTLSPVSWSQTVRIFIVVLVLLLLLFFLYAVRALLGPLAIAGLIAYTLHPVVNRLQTHDRFSYQASVRLIYIPFVIILAGAVGLLIPFLISQAEFLSSEIQIIMLQIQDFAAQPIVIWGQTINQADWMAYLELDTTSWGLATDNALHVLEATSTSLVWFILIVVVIYYLLLDWRKMRDWLIGLAPKREQPDIRRLLHEIDGLWNAYLRGTLALMLMMGVFFTIVGLLIGLPGAIALGILTGLLSMVPEIGPTIAAIIAGAVALFQGSSYLPLPNFWFAVLVVGIYFVVMQLKSFWIRPLVMGRFMHMNTGIVFVAVIGAVLLFGILAALIVLPLLATVGQIGYFIRCRLLGIEPWAMPADQSDSSERAET